MISRTALCVSEGVAAKGSGPKATMLLTRVMLVAVSASMGCAAIAAPAEQIECAYGQIGEEQRLLIGDSMISPDSQRQQNPPTPGLAQAEAAVEAALTSCATQYGWTADEANAAMSFTMSRMIADIAKYYVQRLGGDQASADLFYAQNKYKMLDEAAAGRASDEWANTRLVEMGFAPKVSKAFDAVWLYFSMLFQADAQRETFVTGAKPEAAGAPVE